MARCFDDDLLMPTDHFWPCPCVYVRVKEDDEMHGFFFSQVLEIRACRPTLERAEQNKIE